MKQTIKFGVLLRTAFGCIHGPISAATTHIGSSCASTGDQSRLDHALVTGLGQSIAGPVSYPKPGPKPIIPLFCAAVTVMAKWLYIQQMAILS